MTATTTAPVTYADRYDPDTHFDRWYTDATAAQITEWIEPGQEVLELGAATGRMTEALTGAGAHVIGIEHSADYLAIARDRATRADFHRADIETWAETAAGGALRFDHIVATNVVHELEDVDALFHHCRRLARPRALLHVSLQNPASIHRLTGVALGVIDDPAEVTPEGRDLLTRRLYDADELSELMGAAGFEVIDRRGVMLKPFPNARMAELSDDQLRGLVAVGPLFPEHAAMNYLIGMAR